ncbi:MAG: toxic anion resistance protein [Firmicutes bacterium]|nr:toxic anion resistance protein [Bacillota bacterium]
MSEEIKDEVKLEDLLADPPAAPSLSFDAEGKPEVQQPETPAAPAAAEAEEPAAPAASLSFGAAAAVQEAPQEAPKVDAATAEQQKQANLESTLTPEELRQVESFVSQIDVKNSAGVMNYGVGTQKKLADFSEKALSSVRTKDMGEIGSMITTLVTELKNFEVDTTEKGLKGFFKKKANSLDMMKAKYSKVETNVTTIQNELEKHQVTLLKDSAMLDQMYDMNLTYFKELTMYLLAGRKKLEQVRAVDLVEAQKKAELSGLAEDAQAAKDLAAMCERFEKKLHDLDLTRTIAMQTAPQIRMVQNSDTMMAEKIQSTIVNTIPLWKNQMVIAIGIEHASQAAHAQHEVSEMTNELLRKNAEALKTATVQGAKESERGIVDIETLKHTNQLLISTMDEVLAIQKEGKEKRAAAQSELVAIESQLKEKLLEASRN